MPKTEIKKVKKTTEEVFGDTLRVGVSVGVTLAAGFQSVKFEATAEGACKVVDRKTAFDKLWNVCDAQIAERIPEGKNTLKALIQIRTSLE